MSSDFFKNYFFRFYQKWFLNTLVDSLPKPWKRLMPERDLRQSLIIVWTPVSPGKRCVCGRGKGLARFFTDSSLLWGMASRAACVPHSYHSCWMAPLFTPPVFSGERGWVLIVQATGWQWLWFSTSEPRSSSAACWYSCHSSNSLLPLPISIYMWWWLSTFSSVWILQHPFLILLILLTCL